MVGIRWPDGLSHRVSVYDYTIEEYLTLLRANPDNTSILYNLGWKQFEEGFYTDSVASFDRVLLINPTDIDAQYNLLIVKLYMELDIPPLKAIDFR